MNPSASPGIQVQAPPPRAWLVWFDLACDDVLALPPAQMTPALERELAAAGIEVHQVQAPTRKEAIDKAFPEGHRFHALVKGRQGGVRRPGRRLN